MKYTLITSLLLPNMKPIIRFDEAVDTDLHTAPPFVRLILQSQTAGTSDKIQSF